MTWHCATSFDCILSFFRATLKHNCADNKDDDEDDDDDLKKNYS